MFDPKSGRRRVTLALLALIGALAAGPAPAQPSRAPVTVFAAASLKNAMDEVIAAFTARTGIAARASYAASSAIARQIEQGAPADVFISADVDWMDYLARRDLIVADTRRDLLSNHLALIAPADSKLTLPVGRGMPLARALGDDRLAMAGPDVPAGRYGEAALVSLGVWDSVKDKLARAESVRAALAFVAKGECPLGVVYDTDAKVEPKVRIVGLFPDASHPPIVYPIARVKASRDADAAALVRFVEGPQAASIFRRYGFLDLASRLAGRIAQQPREDPRRSAEGPSFPAAPSSVGGESLHGVLAARRACRSRRRNANRRRASASSRSAVALDL